MFSRLIEMVRRFFQQRNSTHYYPGDARYGYRPGQEYDQPNYRGEPYGPGYEQQGEFYPPPRYPQQGEAYPSPRYPRQGYPQYGYPQPYEYAQPGYPQRQGMNPLVAGGLGALGGGLAGYGLGQAIGGMDQLADHPLVNEGQNQVEAFGDQFGAINDGAGFDEMGFGGDFGEGDF